MTGGLRRSAGALALALAGALGFGAAAQEGGAGLGGPGAVSLLSGLGGQTLEAVEIRISGSTGDAARDAAVAAEAGARLRLRAGDRLTAAELDAARLRLEALEGVAEAGSTLDPSTGADRLRLVFDLRLGPMVPAPAARGMLAGEGRSAFPILWRDEDSLLRVQLNGGFGGFVDSNPWFGDAPAFTTGNPLVQDPARGARTGDTAAWAEGYVEFGLSGVTRLGRSNFAVYGAATAIAPGSVGRDIFRDDARAGIDVEKLYAGLLWGSDDRARSVNLSVGRQDFTLNTGFLVGQYGSQWNAGPRPGIYLAPRTAHDFAAIGTVKRDAWTATAFLLDPNEYEPLESKTQLLGVNLRKTVDARHQVDATVLHVPQSNLRYGAPTGAPGTRDGLWTYAGHVRRRAPPGGPGFWAEAELAHQRHDDFDMNAWAGYGALGYIARDLPWTPSLSYRFAHFTGDDPATRTFERFDPLYTGGLSYWLQGITINKALAPTNRSTHRVRFNVAPDPRLNLTLDWFLHIADQRNNIGANPALAALASDDLGQEFQFVARRAISPRLYVVGVASLALPGDAISAATGGDADPWSSLQAQLYWNF